MDNTINQKLTSFRSTSSKILSDKNVKKLSDKNFSNRPLEEAEKNNSVSIKDVTNNVINKNRIKHLTTDENMGKTYDAIFTGIGLDYRRVRAGSGEIGGSLSHEYVVLADSGEDKIGYCDDEKFAANVEMIDGDTAPNGGQLSYARGIEVGHIFQLGDKYSKHMNCVVLNEKGNSTHPSMGCYGIGI